MSVGNMFQSRRISRAIGGLAGFRGRTVRRARAFTLLEMLLAVGLCSFLMITLWIVYAAYADLFDRGQARVERSQLSRALMLQIAEDLRAAIQDPLPGQPAEPAGAVQRRRFGLSGTRDGLRIDVLQVTPLQGNPVPVGRERQRAQASGARVPELRTITYEFRGSAAGNSAEGVARHGLARRELDFETPLEPADLNDELPDQQNSEGQNGRRAADDRWVFVPEVSGLRFRYYSGTGWTGSWNSLQRRSLPVAVEVTLEIGDPQARESAGEWDEEFAAASSRRSGASVTTLQMIVDLPASPNYRQPPPEPRPAEAPRPAAPPRATPPRIAPPRWTPPAESKPTRLQDDWIRTQRD